MKETIEWLGSADNPRFKTLKSFPIKNYFKDFSNRLIFRHRSP